MSKEKIKVTRRQATRDDVDGIVKLDQRVWNDIGFPGTREMFKSRIKIFPEGNIVAEAAGKIVGYMCHQLIDYDLNQPSPFTWDEITDNGYLVRTHKKDGKFEYGVALTVDPNYQNKGIAVQLFMKAWEIALRFNVKACVLGCRIPGFKAASDNYTVDEYLHLRRADGKLHDPELRLFRGDGFTISIPLPNYINDLESCNYGVLVYQNNPFYNRGPQVLRNIIGTIISKWGHKIIGI